MNIDKMQTQLGHIRKLMAEKGVDLPEASLSFTADGVFVTLRCDVMKKQIDGLWSRMITGSNYQEALSSAQLFIENMAHVEDGERKEWARDLGRHIDKGRDLGVDDEIMAPLTSTMKVISKNLLTSEAAQ